MWIGESGVRAIVSAAEVADTIYHNGTIVTLDDSLPLAEAVAVRDGRILAVGTESEVLALAGQNTRLMDLEGKTLVPGFVESHGHTYMMGVQAATANLLPPPDGDGADVAAIQRLMTAWAEENTGVVERIGWIVGFGYDDSQLTEQRHPTRQELDAVSVDYPVIIIHQSGHLGVANSKALELAEVTAETPNPPGGVFRREADGSQPNGVMEEYAFFYLMSKLAANFDQDINQTLVVEGARLATSFGYTTLQEGRSTQEAVDAMRQVAEKGGLKVDLVAYPDVLLVDDVKPSMSYSGRFRVGGVKLTIDGSPQGKTAFLSQPYFVVPEGQPGDYRGYAAIDEETVTNAIEKAYANGWQILTHANGDAAIDMLIEAIRAVREKYPDADLRPVLIHGQTVRRDQVAALDELSIFPSLFPMHTLAIRIHASALADRSIDVQTDIWHADLTGLYIANELLLAAAARRPLATDYAALVASDNAIARLLSGDWTLNWTDEYRFVSDEPSKVRQRAEPGLSRVLAALREAMETAE